VFGRPSAPMSRPRPARHRSLPSMRQSVRAREFNAAVRSAVCALAFLTPHLSRAETISFSGKLTQDAITLKSAVPIRYEFQGRFTGSFAYDPTARANHRIYHLFVDFGGFQIAADADGRRAGGTIVSEGSIEYANSSSIALSGDLAAKGIGIDGFYLTFAEPMNGAPIDTSAPDFDSFQTKTIEFDLANPPFGGEIRVFGRIDSVSVSEPGLLQ